MVKWLLFFAYFCYYFGKNCYYFGVNCYYFGVKKGFYKEWLLSKELKEVKETATAKTFTSFSVCFKLNS